MIKQGETYYYRKTQTLVTARKPCGVVRGCTDHYHISKPGSLFFFLVPSADLLEITSVGAGAQGPRK